VPRFPALRSNLGRFWTIATGLGLAAAAAGVPAVVTVTASPPAYALDNGLARTPPMGFNDWNAFGCNVSGQLIEQTALAMHNNGMQAAGYQYVNIDDCWPEKQRDANGNLVPDPVKFPDGIKGVAGYVHALGMKLGIYEDAGTATCAGYPGSLGHEKQDAATFASWGVDYLKYDNCNNAGSTTTQQYIQRYSAMRDALAATGRPILYSLCEWGVNQPWTWGADVGNMWRTTGDISDSFGSMVSNFTQNVQLYKSAHPGAWNDPDMLEIGNGGMTTAEQQAEFSLWSEMAAPLIAGTDVRHASPATLSIYTNKAVVAVDQDPLGQQGVPVVQSAGHWVLTKPLANGDRAVVLFNQDSTPAAISASAAQVGLTAPRQGQHAYQLTDLWTGKRYETAGTIAASVPAHSAVMFRVHPTSQPDAAPLVVTSPGGAAGTWLQGGQPADARATVTNYGVAAAAHVRVGWSQVPPGWQVTSAGSNPATTALPPGRSASYAWTVTPPTTSTSEPIATVQPTLNTSWTAAAAGGEPAQWPVAVPFNVVYSPVQAPYQTYSSATDAPAHFGQLGQKFAIDAAGSDVWVGADDYGATYQKGVADATSTVQTEVVSQQNVSGFAKAGIIVRNNVAGAGTSPEGVILYESPEDGIQLGWNDNGGTYIDNQTPGIGAIPDTTPVWLRLVRNGSTYTGYYSTDGSTWHEVGSETLSGQASTQDAGLFLSSHATGDPGLVYYNGFNVTG
jgi:alpha-galactosidase